MEATTSLAEMLEYFFAGSICIVVVAVLVIQKRRKLQKR